MVVACVPPLNLFFCRRQLPRVRELQTEGNDVQQFK